MTQASSLIELVATAVSFSLPADVTLTGTQERAIALAAIKAMREPTDAMTEAALPPRPPSYTGDRAAWDDAARNRRAAYRAMIDAALVKEAGS